MTGQTAGHSQDATHDPGQHSQAKMRDDVAGGLDGDAGERAAKLCQCAWCERILLGSGRCLPLSTAFLKRAQYDLIAEHTLDCGGIPKMI